MESYSSKMGLCAVAAFGLAMVATFSACGDENTTEVNESTGLDIVAKGDTLPECGSDNAGDMVFVADSSAVFYCADEKWSTLNGKDGEKGVQGEVGAAGTNCTAKAVENGIEVSCGDTVIGTIKNGETGVTGAQGEKGDKGDTGAEGKATNGTSCTAKTVENGIEVSCDGKVVGTLKNGEPGQATDGVDGKSACALALGKDEECSADELAGWLASLKGESCTAKTVENGIEVSCGGKVVGTLKNGEPGQATDGVDGKSACALALGKDEECSEDELADWLASLKGKSCTAKTVENGIEVSCGGELVGTLTNGTDGKSAYELAKENDENVGELANWLASLKGDAGKNCTIADVKDPNDATKVIGYEITCGEDKKVVNNGTDGKPGAGCTVTDKGDGIVKVACGDDENAEPVTLYKAVCGTDGYDPEKKFCAEGKTYDLCGGVVYDPKKQYCSAQKGAKDLSSCGGSLYNPEVQYCSALGLPVNLLECGEKLYFNPEKQYCLELGDVKRVEALLVDDRDNNSVRLYNTVTIGTQVWMAENLEYKTDGTSWCSGGNSAGSNCTAYGRLYTWEAAKTVCPDGWKLPSKEDWVTLLLAVGGTLKDGGTYADVYVNADNFLKSKGFNSQYAGYALIGSSMDYKMKDEVGDFWTSTPVEDGGYRVALGGFNPGAGAISYASTDYAFSVRCIKK